MRVVSVEREQAFRAELRVEADLNRALRDAAIEAALAEAQCQAALPGVLLDPYDANPPEAQRAWSEANTRRDAARARIIELGRGLMGGAR